ncbi:MAG: hypothetical protein CL772_04300 [Chloroflexi bacterium]|nr:hypothetical protein [Chloroflexota bacterium]MBK90381.1 hypothetical protein [Chloroflexota bacterium]|tara:strand:- start:5879 stop:6292 length:414 start_codon:yes stop_codon:yes gene_type:complete
MNPEKIILLLEKEKNEEILDCVVPFIKEYSTNVYFLYVIEVPVKYDIDYEIGSEINIGENILSDVNKYLLTKKINYDLNGENFILLQSRNAGVGIVKESKRLSADIIFYRKNKNDSNYKFEYINKHSEADTIQLLKV